MYYFFRLTAAEGQEMLRSNVSTISISITPCILYPANQFKGSLVVSEKERFIESSKLSRETDFTLTVRLGDMFFSIVRRI